MKRYAPRVLLALAVAALAMAAVMAGADSRSSRQITLEARDMAFYLPGDATPNPTLRLKAGESVRLVLVNRDRGMSHDVAVDALGVATRMLRGDGSSTSVVLRAPTAPGEHDYVCSLHRQTMRGRLIVGEP